VSSVEDDRFGGQENVVDLGLYRPTPKSYTDTRYLQLNFYTDTDIGVVQRLFTWCRYYGSDQSLLYARGASEPEQGDERASSSR